MATIYDVAREAGVSPKTVSRVINGDVLVKAKTRQHVQETIGNLAYIPSNAARAMRSNKTGLVGLMTGAISTSATTPDVSGLPELFIIKSIQRVLSDAGITPLIADTGVDAARAATLVKTFAQHRVEALIYVADFHQQIELPDIPSNGPLLLVNCFDDAGTPCILPDDKAGQQALVNALIHAGHRRIGFITLAPDRIAHQRRLEGYRAALSSAGIPYDPDLVTAAGLHHAGPQEVVLMGDAVSQFMSLKDRPTVLCCGNDRMAMQLYGILRSRGIAVPGDISVAGFDDYKMISETLYPPLTTVVLPYEEMGKRAGEALLNHLRGDDALFAEVISVHGPVVWRQSVTAQSQCVTNTQS